MRSNAVTPDEILRIVRLQNPWWEDGVVPSSFTRRGAADPVGSGRPFVRDLLPPVSGDFHRFRLIVGPRRVGKTTAMYRTVEKAIADGVEPSRLVWIRLDHPRLMHRSLDDIVLPLLEVVRATPERPALLFLDEIAYLSDWDLWLKTAYDDHWPVRIVATSSAVARLRKGGESGAGRWTEIRLMPYLFDEALSLAGDPPPAVPASVFEAPDLHSALVAAADDPRFVSGSVGLRDALMDFLLVGGFPETVADFRERRDILRAQEILRDDAFDKIVFKDIPQAFGMSDPVLLQQLAYSLAGQVGQVFSPSNLASPLGASIPTLLNYARYLSESFLMFFLPNWSRSERSVQSRGRKAYLVDGALRGAILQRGEASRKDRAETGHLFENAAASHLWNYAGHANARLFHWRDKSIEVDLVLEETAGRSAFEIGTGEKQKTPGLGALIRRDSSFSGRTWQIGAGLSAGQTRPPADGVHGLLPLEAFLLVAGALAGRGAVAAR